MMSRRNLLLGSTATMLWPIRANAFLPAIPVIVGALRAITILAGATGAAASALGKAIEGGARLYNVVTAQTQRIKAETKIQTVMESARPQIEKNLGSAVTDLNDYVRKPTPEKWPRIVLQLSVSCSGLYEIARLLRTDASSFPQSAQKDLAALANSFEASNDVLFKIQQLAAIEPPKSDDELKRLRELITRLDDLRTHAVTLLKNIERYIEPLRSH